MPELTPTMATALVREDGSVETVLAGAAKRFATVVSKCKGEEFVPCLILPAPRPIEQCPEEWKDGRNVWIWINSTQSSAWFSFFWAGDDWLDFDNESIDWYVSYGGTPTHIMLPPPSPEEANHA